MKILLYIIVLSLPFIMPFIMRYLEEVVSAPPKKAMKPDGKPDVSEALQILELQHKASENEIREAHRRMISKNHPDNGGSRYLASKINWARDVLINSCKAA